jgi:putative ABC transport system permease protein
MALGAPRAKVLKLVLGKAILLSLCGVGLGLLASLAMTRLMRGLIYGVGPSDPLTLIAVAVVLGLITMMASYIPARRATKVDPLVALRYE